MLDKTLRSDRRAVAGLDHSESKPSCSAASETSGQRQRFARPPREWQSCHPPEPRPGHRAGTTADMIGSRDDASEEAAADADGELRRESGVAIVQYYQREGLLPPGEPTSPTKPATVRRMCGGSRSSRRSPRWPDSRWPPCATSSPRSTNRVAHCTTYSPPSRAYRSRPAKPSPRPTENGPRAGSTRWPRSAAGSRRYRGPRRTGLGREHGGGRGDRHRPRRQPAGRAAPGAHAEASRKRFGRARGDPAGHLSAGSGVHDGGVPRGRRRSAARGHGIGGRGAADPPGRAAAPSISRTNSPYSAAICSAVAPPPS